jgi:hypothetical protein
VRFVAAEVDGRRSQVEEIECGNQTEDQDAGDP